MVTKRLTNILNSKFPKTIRLTHFVIWKMMNLSDNVYLTECSLDFFIFYHCIAYFEKILFMFQRLKIRKLISLA